MIDKVVVYDIRFGSNYIDSKDIKQMLARCGRTYNKFEQGTSYVFCKKNEEEIVKSYFYDDDSIVSSKLNNFDELTFHLMPLIMNGEVKNIDGIKKWYERSLSFHQGFSLNYDLFVEMMIQRNLIDKDFNLSDFSKISAKYYYPISTVSIIDNKLKSNFRNLSDQYVIPWLMSIEFIPIYFNSPHFDEFKNNVKGKSFDLSFNELNQMYLFYCMLSCYRPVKLRRYITGFLNDIHRFFGMFTELCKLNNIDDIDYIDMQKQMMLFNVNENTIVFMREINNFDKKFISDLNAIGIYSKRDLINKLFLVERTKDEDLINKVNNIIQGCTNER